MKKVLSIFLAFAAILSVSATSVYATKKASEDSFSKYISKDNLLYSILDYCNNNKTSKILKNVFEDDYTTAEDPYFYDEIKEAGATTKYYKKNFDYDGVLYDYVDIYANDKDDTVGVCFVFNNPNSDIQDSIKEIQELVLKEHPEAKLEVKGNMKERTELNTEKVLIWYTTFDWETMSDDYLQIQLIFLF